jgi:hypothetical protein
MSRWKASGIYLLVCALVALAVLVFMKLVWFPGPLFELTGGNQLLFILVSVDVVLGPLLVLVVYKPGKGSLKFDLAVIAILQLSALGYGLYTVSLARPAYVVFTLDRFDVVTAKDLDPEDLAKVKQPKFDHVPWGRPQFIGVIRPSDPREAEHVLNSALAGKDLQNFPQYYVEYASQAQQALQRAQPIDSIQKRSPDLVDDYLSKANRAASSVRYLPLRAPKQDGAVLVDAVTAEPLVILSIDPWQ